MRRRPPLLLAVCLVTAATLAGCSAAAPMPTPPLGAVVVTAQATAFVEQSTTVPAGTPFTVFFANRDGEPHNLRLWDAANNSVAATEVFSGPAAQTLDVAALAPGTYRFSCDIHHEMNAALIVQ